MLYCVDGGAVMVRTRGSHCEGRVLSLRGQWCPHCGDSATVTMWTAALSVRGQCYSHYEDSGTLSAGTVVFHCEDSGTLTVRTAALSL